MRVNISLLKIPHKWRKYCSAFQCIAGYFDPVNSEACDILRFCDILHEVSLTCWMVEKSHIRSLYKQI